MPEITVVYWRDIPAQVIAKAGRKAAKRELSQRFQEAIDRAAMRGKAADTDAYLADWRRGGPAPCGDDLEAAADAKAAEIEAAYHDASLETLIRNDGREA
jgi:hypothetical protein